MSELIEKEIFQNNKDNNQDVNYFFRYEFYCFDCTLLSNKRILNFARMYLS